MFMVNRLLLECTHWVKGLAPVANAFAGTVRSDVVSVRSHEKVVFYVRKGVGATGTSTLTVEASDDVVPTNVTAIPFKYRAYTGATGTSDAAGAITAATAAGFTTTAGSDQLYVIEVDADAVMGTGYGYVSLKCVEVVASAVLGGIDILLVGQKYQGAAAPGSVIV